MKRTRGRWGHTLVELMVGIACLGILSALAGSALRAERLDAMDAVRRERAVLLLEYEAGNVAHGTTPDPDTLARLTEHVPGGRVTQVSGQGTVTLTVRWEGRSGRSDQRTLTVFGRTP